MTTTLDIMTPRGQQAFESQLRAMEIVFKNSDLGHQFIHTGGEDAARVDGIIVRDNRIKHVAEVKSRPGMTLQQLQGPFCNEWLITYQKLVDLCEVAKRFDVSGYGFLYCIPSRVVLAIPICDQHGRLTCRYRKAHTTTQATCNGGTATRENAFINMTPAIKYLEDAP